MSDRLAFDDLAEPSSDPKYATTAARLTCAAEVGAAVQWWSRRRTTGEVVSASAGHVPCGLLNTAADVACGPHVLPRDLVVELGHPGGGAASVVGSPTKFSGTPLRVAASVSIRGGHTEVVLAHVRRGTGPTP